MTTRLAFPLKRLKQRKPKIPRYINPLIHNHSHDKTTHFLHWYCYFFNAESLDTPWFWHGDRFYNVGSSGSCFRLRHAVCNIDIDIYKTRNRFNSNRFGHFSLRLQWYFPGILSILVYLNAAIIAVRCDRQFYWRYPGCYGILDYSYSCIFNAIT